MSRSVAIIFAVFLLGLVVVVVETEQNHPAESVDISTSVLNSCSQVILAIGLLLYCGFAALHSTQHISSPRDRSQWLIATVGLNVVGSCWYLLTVYQAFRKIGQGGLISFRKEKDA